MECWSIGIGEDIYETIACHFLKSITPLLQLSNTQAFL